MEQRTTVSATDAVIHKVSPDYKDALDALGLTYKTSVILALNAALEFTYVIDPDTGKEDDGELFFRDHFVTMKPQKDEYLSHSGLSYRVKGYAHNMVCIGELFFNQRIVLFDLAAPGVVELSETRQGAQACIPAVLSASVPAPAPEPVLEPSQNSESTERTEIKKSVQALAIACAPRCYYNYDPVAGRRPCTIDMERQHSASVFKQLNLPSCPFKDACFTRSDCMYITGNDVSESEGAERVVRDLRQWDRSVTLPLTKENTQTLRPYL